MQRRACVLLLGACLSSPLTLLAQSEAQHWSAHPGYAAALESFGVQETETPRNSRVPKAMLLSAVVPGLGQAYNGSLLKTGLFLAVEAASLFIYVDQTREGNRLEDVYEAFADAHWDEDTYWNAIAQESGIDRSQMQALRDYERSAFSHHLPEQKNQTYYENIGKYDQFNVGWDDGTLHRGRDSQNRQDYTFMRKDSNDAFSNARTGSTVLMLNHVASALEAAFSAARQGRQPKRTLALRAMRDGHRVVPALSMRMRW